MKEIIVNGESHETEASSLNSLLVELELHAPLILLEHNGTALARSEWDAVKLCAGDRVELLSVAAGG